MNILSISYCLQTHNKHFITNHLNVKMMMMKNESLLGRMTMIMMEIVMNDDKKNLYISIHNCLQLLKSFPSLFLS